jgi:hypothetical protein
MFDQRALDLKTYQMVHQRLMDLRKELNPVNPVGLQFVSKEGEAPNTLIIKQVENGYILRVSSVDGMIEKVISDAYKLDLLWAHVILEEACLCDPAAWDDPSNLYAEQNVRQSLHKIEGTPAVIGWLELDDMVGLGSEPRQRVQVVEALLKDAALTDDPEMLREMLWMLYRMDPELRKAAIAAGCQPWQ